MSTNKTVATEYSVKDFVAGIADTQKRKDCRAIMAMMRKATNKRAKMWGKAIVGYGSYDYLYASGREGTFFLVGLSPRAQNIALYIVPGFSSLRGLLGKLGPHKTGKSCLYIKRLADVDADVLAAIIERSVAQMKKKYGLS